MKHLGILLSFFLIVVTTFSQQVELENKILKNDKDKYHIVTSVYGQDNPGVMRLTLNVPEEYSFKLFNDPNLLIDSRGNNIKFYTQFEIGSSIEVNYQLFKDSDDESEAIIPVQLEYTVNGEMVTVEKEIILSQHEVIEDKTMDSLTTHFEKISKENENRDEIALKRIKELKGSDKSDKEEITSVPVGYNSSSKGLSESSKTYTVQILSLQYFNEQRFNEFLSSYHIKPSDTYKKEINGMVKIYIGKFSSYQEAKQAKENLIKQHNLTDSFIVSY